MQEQTSKQTLEQAREKFMSGDYNLAKTYVANNCRKLEQLGDEDKSIQLNKLLIDFETGSSDNS